nr:endonuclease-reverse transcriptase [Haemonchus contortus]
MDEAAEAGKSIRKARRSFANYKTKMTSLRRPDGTVTASRRAMEKVIYDFYSDLFDSHVYLPTHHLRQDEYIAPSVLPSEIRHAITSMKNCTAPGPDRIKPEHLKSIPPVIIKTLARLFTRYLSECKVPTSWKTSKTVLLYNECSSYVYLGREVNMMNDLAPELCRRKRAAWGAFKNIEGVVKKTKNTRLRAHLFDTAVLPALTYASETWTLRKQDEHAVSVTQRALERAMLGISLYTQVQKGCGVPSSVTERRSGMPLITPRNRRSGGPDTLCDIVMTVGPGRLLTGFLGTSNELQEGRQRDGQTSSRKL